MKLIPNASAIVATLPCRENNSSQGEQSNAYVSKPVEWGTHTNKNCETCKRCEGVMKGGRPRMERRMEENLALIVAIL